MLKKSISMSLRIVRSFCNSMACNNNHIYQFFNFYFSRNLTILQFIGYQNDPQIHLICSAFRWSRRNMNELHHHSYQGQVAIGIEVFFSWNSILNDPDSKVHGANMGPTWSRQGHVSLAIWGCIQMRYPMKTWKQYISSLTSHDLTIKRLIEYWNRALALWRVTLGAWGHIRNSITPDRTGMVNKFIAGIHLHDQLLS